MTWPTSSQLYSRKLVICRGVLLTKIWLKELVLPKHSWSWLLKSELFVMGREVSNPCGTSPSHIMRVSLMKVAQYRLVSPCPKLTRERLQFPTSVCRASPRPLFNVKFSTSNKLHKLNLISLPEHTPLKHVSNINTTIIDTNVQGHILSVTIAIRDILLLKVYVNVMDIKILK